MSQAANSAVIAQSYYAHVANMPTKSTWDDADRIDAEIAQGHRDGGGGGVEKVLSNSTLSNSTGKVDNYFSNSRGVNAAQADFDSLNPNNVTIYPNGTKVGYLADGRTVNIHPSSTLGGTPSVEIYNPSTGSSIKKRY